MTLRTLFKIISVPNGTLLWTYVSCLRIADSKLILCELFPGWSLHKTRKPPVASLRIFRSYKRSRKCPDFRVCLLTRFGSTKLSANVPQVRQEENVRPPLIESLALISQRGDVDADCTEMVAKTRKQAAQQPSSGRHRLATSEEAFRSMNMHERRKSARLKNRQLPLIV